MSPDPSPMETAVGTVRALAVQGSYLPMELRPGQRWSYTLTIDSPIQSSRIDAVLEAVDEGTLEVPAGRFQVVHVESTLHNRMAAKAGASSDSERMEQAVEHTQIEDTYWARGVGLVKATTRTPEGYTSDRELVCFVPGKQLGNPGSLP